MLGANWARLVVTLVVLSHLQIVFASDKFIDFPVRPVSDCAVKAEKAGLTIGVQPVEDVKVQKTYFHTELTPKGFIPVFLVMLNRTSDDSFLFDKTKMKYGVGGPSSPNVDSTMGNSFYTYGNATLSPSSLVVGMILLAKAYDVQQNLLKKELQSTTISPGASVHGFVYIQVPVQKNKSREKIHLQIPVTRVGTDEPIIVDLVF